MAFCLRSSEANTRETLSLSLRLRDARARAWASCSENDRCLSGVCSGDTEIGIRRSRSQPWVVSFKIS